MQNRTQARLVKWVGQQRILQKPCGAEGARFLPTHASMEGSLFWQSKALSGAAGRRKNVRGASTLGAGLGFGYETETYRYVFKSGASVWFFDGNDPFEFRASLDVGFNLLFKLQWLVWRKVFSRKKCNT